MRTKLRSKVTLLFLTFTVLMLVFPAMAFAQTAPTIASDKADYAPGELVTLSGSGWQAGESVNIVVNDDVGQTWSRNVTVTADASGNISDSFNLPDWFVATYTVTATGASGTATTSFTDGNVQVKLAGVSSATISWAKFNGNSTCSGTANSTGSTAVNDTGHTVLGPGAGIDNGQSLRITAPSPVSSKNFSSWSGDLTSTNNPLCVAGQSANRLLTANYAAPDSTAPTVTIVSAVPATLGSSGSSTITWNANENGNFSVRVGGTSCSTGTQVASGSYTTQPNNTTSTVNASALSEGANTIRVCVTDAANNTGSATTTVSKDATAPTNASISIDSGAAWTNSSTGNVSLALSATDNVGIVSYKLAETQAGLSSASAVSVSPAEAAFSRPNVSFTLTGSEAASKAVWLRVTDAQGNSTDVSDTIGWDKTAPTISNLGPTSQPNAAGWYNTDVTNGFKASDSLSGLNAACVTAFPANQASENVQSKTTSGEGTAVKVTSDSCTDVAGNTAAGLDSANFKIDKTAPTISDLGPTTSPNAAGWYNTAVSNKFSATDALSGLADASKANFSVSSGPNEGTAVKINSGSVSDIAGNTNSGIDSAAFKIDLSKPLLNVSGAASGTTFNVCDSGPSRPSFSPFDALSGLDGSQADSWTVPTNASGVGTYVYKADAKDIAGNTESETRTYTKTYGGAFGGVQQPINGGNTPELTDDNSRFKLGSTVPVKFTLTCNGAPINNAVAKLNVKKADGTPDPGTDEAVSTAASTTGNLFRYDAMSGQYIFNLSTKSGYTYTNPNGTTITAFSAGTWTLSVLLDDGTFRSVNINLVK